MFKRLAEIKRRNEELRNSMETLPDSELDKAVKEAEELEKEQKEIIENIKNEDKEIETRAFKISTANITGKVTYGVDSPEYRSAFFKTLAGASLNEIEKRAMTTNSSSAGAAVPTQTLNKIMEKIENQSVIYNLVTVSNLKGNVSIPIEGTTNDVERLSEGTDGTIKNDTLSSIKLGANKYIKLVKLTCELEAQAIDALEDYIVKKLSKKMAQAFDEDIINGNGTNKCTGILQTITPIETSAAGTLNYDDICDLFAALKAAAKKNAKLLMSTNTLYKRIAKIKDDNKRPIFDVENNKVIGRTVEECDDIPDDVIIFGDLSTYQFNWNKDLEITKSQEAAFASGDTVFRGLALVDGKLADLGGIVALKVKTQTESEET